MGWPNLGRSSGASVAIFGTEFVTKNVKALKTEEAYVGSLALNPDGFMASS